MVVSVVWPGAEPEVLQNQVVDRLEKRIQEVEYLSKIETTVRPGRADLQIEFEGEKKQELQPSDHTEENFVAEIFRVKENKVYNISSFRHDRGFG